MSDPRATIEQELLEAAACVARMPASPLSRELRSRLESYKRTIDGWKTRAPTDPQLDAMRDCVAEVLGVARNSAPTVRMKLPSGGSE